MKDKLHALTGSLLTQEEWQHCIFLLFCLGDSSCDEPLLEELQTRGYIVKENDNHVITQKGKQYLSGLMQKLAQFHNAGEIIFQHYVEEELSPIKKEIHAIRMQWRTVRDKRLARKAELQKMGKDKAAVHKDSIYKALQKEQDALRTHLKHAEKKYHKKLANHVKNIGMLP